MTTPNPAQQPILNIDPARFSKFMLVLRSWIESNMTSHPTMYASSLTPEILTERYKTSILGKGIRSLSIRSSPSLIATCKTLGVKPTFGAIEHFLSGA